MSKDTELHNIGTDDERLDNLAKDIHKELESIEHDQEAIPLLNLKAIAKVYVDELKILRQARIDFLNKKKWIEESVRILDKRIEVNLGALKTLGMPESELTEAALMGKSAHEIEG